MLTQILIFVIALTILIFSANNFTRSAEKIGHYFRMPPFVIGVFIVGIGTSLPELVSSIASMRASVSEIVSGNVVGSNISNLLLITGLVAVLNRKEIQLSHSYIFIHLHYLIGSFFIFTIIAYDGTIYWYESIIGLFAYVAYSIYLIRNENAINETPTHKQDKIIKFPTKESLIVAAASLGIFFGAEYTVSSLTLIASLLNIPPSIIALTILSIGTTLPEIAVNISAIRQGKAEMAIGNVLGSSIFNSLIIPAVASFIGKVSVPTDLISFSLPLMLGSGLFFYLLTHDKKISHWEGSLFIFIYILFIMKVIM